MPGRGQALARPFLVISHAVMAVITMAMTSTTSTVAARPEVNPSLKLNRPSRAHQDESDDGASHQQEGRGDDDQPPGCHQRDGGQQGRDDLHEEQRAERRDVPVGDIPEMQVDKPRRDEEPGVDDAERQDGQLPAGHALPRVGGGHWSGTSLVLKGSAH